MSMDTRNQSAEPDRETIGKMCVMAADMCKRSYVPYSGFHVGAALLARDGRIFTGFCIEGCSGVMNLCAERVAGLNMYIQTGQTVVKRMVAFRDAYPSGVGSGMPCGACREFFMQLNQKNADIEILEDFASRKTVKLREILPNWWGDQRCIEVSADE